jgi:membrane protease YdiL (CAAX protease family)
MGVVLAVAYLATKRALWPLVLAHLYIDTLLLVQLYASSPAPHPR